MCKYDNMQSLQKKTFFTPIFGLYAHITCKVWILHIDGMWIWCFSPVSKFCMFICLDIEAEGGLSQSVFEHGIIWGGRSHPLFPRSQTFSYCFFWADRFALYKTICKPASLKKANTVSEYILDHSQENLVTCWIILVRHFCGILNISRHVILRGRKSRKFQKYPKAAY